MLIRWLDSVFIRVEECTALVKLVFSGISWPEEFSPILATCSECVYRDIPGKPADTSFLTLLPMLLNSCPTDQFHEVV